MLLFTMLITLLLSRLLLAYAMPLPRATCCLQFSLRCLLRATRSCLPIDGYAYCLLVRCHRFAMPPDAAAYLLAATACASERYMRIWQQLCCCCCHAVRCRFDAGKAMRWRWPDMAMPARRASARVCCHCCPLCSLILMLPTRAAVDGVAALYPPIDSQRQGG